ncbi:MAG: hypothetical protein Pg6C_06180 [Treponemataceae bacterium]|nr:MAG: hypothetical protein Pg6C_06180 [Treponemataceae bacterium]
MKGTGKNYTLSKPEDFKYDLTKIDGKDYVVIKGVNKPSGFQGPKSSGSNTVLIDTLTVKIPEKIEGYTVGVIDELALAWKAITAVTIPDTIVEIGVGAVGGTSISSIKLPKNLKKLGPGAISGCKNLGSVTIPAGITEIPESAFSGCESLKEVVIPDSVTVIGGNAFSGCKELTTVKLPSHPLKYTLSYGENDAFRSCPKLSLAVRNAIKESGYPDEF